MLSTVNNTNNISTITGNITGSLTSNSTSHSSNNSSTSSDDTYMGCKFLTSSRLFSLQLQDPHLRLQIIAQLLFMVRYLKFAPISLGGSSSKSKSNKAEIEKVEEEMRVYLNALEQRLFSLCLATPYGKEFNGLIRRMLQREGNWLTWKANSCPEFEKNEQKIDLAAIVASYESKANVKKYVEPEPKTYVVTLAPDDIKAVAKSIFTAPDFDEYIKSYEEADDPENGIEEEYHPKHDALYCWRARRLMAERHLSVFANMLDGNIGRGLKKIRGIDEGDGDTTGKIVAANTNDKVDDDINNNNNDKADEDRTSEKADDINFNDQVNDQEEVDTTSMTIESTENEVKVDNNDNDTSENKNESFSATNESKVDDDNVDLEDAHMDKKRKLEDL